MSLRLGTRCPGAPTSVGRQTGYGRENTGLPVRDNKMSGVFVPAQKRPCTAQMRDS